MRKWITFKPINENYFSAKIVDFAQNINNALILTDANFKQEKEYQKLSNLHLLAGFYANSFITQLTDVIVNDWYLGFISYRSNENKKATIDFPNIYFFQPQFLIIKNNGIWKIGYLSNKTELDALNFIQEIENIEITEEKTFERPDIKSSFTKEEYLHIFEKIQRQIKNNKLLEINLAIEFMVDNIKLSPSTTFEKLNSQSPMPLSAFLKHNDKYAFCASPERYLQKKGDKIFTMPMKGTAKKGKSESENRIIADKLRKSEKERAENIMVVEGIKNQLINISKKDSINVDELCGVYSFPNIYQMVSTISATLKNNTKWYEAIESTFPMGSMTGVPQQKAMELIDELEPNNRGLFSGAIGYITPEKDFDFNVVIRSLFYDNKNKKTSFWAGSAITKEAVGEDEYEECMVKSEVIKNIILSID